MKLERGTYCPLLKKDCVGLKCAWFTQIRGTDPNSGKEVDSWECAIAWLPMLMINAANEARQGAAATESFRNEMVAAVTTARKQKELLAEKEEPDHPMITINGD